MRLLKSNKGVGLVSVLLVSSMLLVLGAACVFGSYVNALMKETDRGTRKNFYALESVLDERRERLMGYMSEAIEKAYLAKLQDYENVDFRNEFRNILLTLLAGDGDFSGLTFETLADGTLRVIDAIKVNTNTEGKEIVVGDTGEGHNYSNISTGFIITMPTFTPIDEELTHLKDFIVIAGGELTGTAGGNATFNGNVYAKNIVVGDDTTNNSEWTFTNGRFEMPYNIYVGNDLNIKGSNCTVTLNGAYIGMGDSKDDADESSAILINGRDNKLFMNGLNKIHVAGKGFIWNDTPGTEWTIPMGNTLTVKSDQLAYLVRDEYFSDGLPNPRIYDEDALPRVIDESKFPVGVDLVEPCIVRYAKLGTQMLQYYFWNFGNDDGARITYFSRVANDKPKEKFSSYLSTFEYDGINIVSGFYGLAWVNAPLGVKSSGYNKARALEYMRITLEPDKERQSGGISDTPAGFYILKAPIGDTIFEGENGTKALLRGGSDILIDSPSDYSLIACDGNVTVSVNFEGLIIATGNVIVESTAVLSENDLTDLYTTGRVVDAGGNYDPNGELLQDYLRFYWKAGGAVVDWDLGALGNFDRWIKNED